MRALSSSAFGIEHLHVEDRPDPSCGPRQVAVRVRAISLNYRDLLMVTGRYNPRQRLPLVPCSDGAGEVVAVGADVTTVRVGDRVCGMFAQGWLDGGLTKDDQKRTLGGPLDGMARELVVLDEDGVAPFPASYSFEEAACLPCAALTAWSALVELGGVGTGDTVLVLGTGGVSLFALQIAKLRGARAIVTSKSDEKLAKARALGADETISYAKDPAWDKIARAVTDGRGVDHVVEVGGAGTLERSLRAVRPSGTVSLIGVLADGEVPSLVSVLMNQVRVQGVFVGHRRAFVDMSRAFADSDVKPVIDRVVAFDDAPGALAALARGEHFGKIVVRVG